MATTVYETEKITLSNGSNALIVRGVEVMSFISEDERPDFGVNIDEAWLKESINIFNLRKGKGKYPRLLLRHNKPDQEAEVIGRMINMRYDAPFVVADLVVTNPDAAAKIERGELPSRSAEFSPKRHLIWGLSLIEGEEGHFDEEIPDLMVNDPEFEKLNANGEFVSLQIGETGPMPLDEEMKAEIRELIRSEIAAAISEMKGEETPTQDAPVSEDVEEQVMAAAHKLTEKYKLEAEEAKTKHEINTYIVSLKASGHCLNDKQLRAMFEKRSTVEGREELFKRLSSQTKTEQKIELDEVEAEDDDNPRKILTAEFNKLKDSDGKVHGANLERYIELNTNEQGELL